MTSTSSKLHIYEQVLLLALRDKKGDIFFDVKFSQAMAGALIAELLLTKKIKIEQSGKKKFIKAVDLKQTGNPLLDECIGKIKKAKRRARIQTWVERFSNISRLKNKGAQSLIAKKILKMEEEKILLFFNRKIYPEIDPRPEKDLISKMEKAIFSSSRNIDPELVILIAICQNTDILKHIFDRKKLRERKKWIKEVTSGSAVGQATKEAVEAMQAAVMVAAIIPAVSVATTAGS